MVFNGGKVAFVGAGVMGEAIIKGLLHQKLLGPESITASDPRAEHLQQLHSAYGINVTTDNGEAARGADVLVLSVKPQVMGRVLPELRGRVDGVRLIVSIVAGVPVKVIADSLLNVRVVRSMPNTPGQIGQGITVWTASPEVADEQRRQAEVLLGALGEHIYAEEERFLDMATALSGSGPAYVFMFMEAMVDVGSAYGILAARFGKTGDADAPRFGTIRPAIGLASGAAAQSGDEPGWYDCGGAARNGEGRLADSALRRRLGGLSTIAIIGIKGRIGP